MFVFRGFFKKAKNEEDGDFECMFFCAGGVFVTIHEITAQCNKENCVLQCELR